MEYLDAFANQAATPNEKQSIERVYDQFFGAMKSTVTLNTEDGVKQLQALLNSEGIKKLSRANYYYASLGATPPQYTDSATKKKYTLQKNDQSGEYEIMEQGAGNP